MAPRAARTDALGLSVWQADSRNPNLARPRSSALDTTATRRTQGSAQGARPTASSWHASRPRRAHRTLSGSQVRYPIERGLGSLVLARGLRPLGCEEPAMLALGGQPLLWTGGSLDGPAVAAAGPAPGPARPCRAGARPRRARSAHFQVGGAGRALPLPGIGWTAT